MKRSWVFWLLFIGNGSEVDDNPFRYCGEYFDEETGTYYLRARNYVPDLGRFTQWDSYNGDLTIPASLNHYVYCYSDPIGYVDPMGHWAETGLDLASAVLSAHDFDEDPSFINGLLLGWDAFALFAPAIPALGTIKHLDDVADVGKVVDKGVDVVEAIGKAAIKRADKIDGIGTNQSTSVNYIIDILKSGTMTPDGRNIITQIDDNTKIIFRMDVGENAHSMRRY